MNREEKAYQSLIRGISQYVRDTVNKYSDRTCTGIISSVSSAEDNTYSVNINGNIYPNVGTIGGTCAVNETVYVLIPQGNYSNMFILKGGSSSNQTVATAGVTSFNGRKGAVTLTSDDVSNVTEKQTVETEDLDFTSYFGE